jgi:uncharacterized protein (TIGR02300 family)
VPKIDLGVKQLCPACGAKFYDLHKRPAQCPKCGNVFDPDDETVKAKRARVARAPAAFDPALDEEDEEAAAKAKDEDADEEEVEATPEIDEVADEPPLVVADEDDDSEAPKADEDLSDGFTEGDLEDVEGADADDDDVPFLEDDEDFPDDELDEIVPGEDEDDKA